MKKLNLEKIRKIERMTSRLAIAAFENKVLKKVSKEISIFIENNPKLAYSINIDTALRELNSGKIIRRNYLVGLRGELHDDIWGKRSNVKPSAKVFLGINTEEIPGRICAQCKGSGISLSKSKKPRISTRTRKIASS